MPCPTGCCSPPTSAEVLPAGHKIIAELADVAKHHGGKVEVDGFTDTIGTLRHNDKLSVARAESVATELSQAGVERERIETRGYGERELAVETPEQHARSQEPARGRENSQRVRS